MNALTGIRKLIPCSRASITLFDHEMQHVIILAINMDNRLYGEYGKTIPFSEYGEYILEKLKQNQACFVDDLRTDPRATNWDKRLAEEGFCTWLYLPLLYQGQLIGSLNLARGVGARFTEADAELGYDIANPLAIAIRQARLTDALQIELGERKQIEADLRQREAILEAVTFAGEQFLKSPDWRENIDLVLERLGRTINATHAYLFEDHLNERGELVTSMRYEWTAPGYPSDLDGPYFQNSLVNQAGFEEQVEKLKRGEARTGTTSTFNPVEKRAMDDLGVKAILEMPVFVNGKEWGAIGFDDFEAERDWSPAEVDTLKIAAGILGGAIQQTLLHNAVQVELEGRKRVEESLREREAILEAVTFSAERFLQTPEWRVNINAVLERLGATLGASHAYLFEHYVGVTGVEYSSLKYEWTAPGIPSDFGNPYYQQAHPLNMDENSTDHLLRQGNIVMGNLSTVPVADRDRLAKLGVKAMAELPVFVEGKWWGTLGFDDFESEREWSVTEIDALKIAAGILSAAIQRQETESAVRASEQIYRQAIEAAGAVPYYRDYREDRYLFMGSGIERMIGYKPEDVTVALLQGIMLENIPLGEAEHLDIDEAVSLARTGKIKIWKSDMRVTARHGEERWISDSAVELFDESEYSHASVGILQDVTDRKRTEASLRKRELMLEASTYAAEQFLRAGDWRETINDVLARLGREFNASHAYLFEKHLGAGGVMLNSLRYEWTAPGQKSDMDNPAYQNATVNDVDFKQYYEILDSGEPFVGGSSYFYETESEQAWMKETGIKAMLEMRIVVDGWQWGTIGFDDMVNEREWTPMEVDVIRVAASVLGAAIKRQLDEAALKKELEARKQLIEELENKNSELERFTYTVSHDLKSPLVTINGFLGFLEQDATSGNLERMRRDIQRIHEAVKKMQSLLNELLELSRIGRMMNAPETVPFDLLVRDTLEMVQGRLSERKVEVDAHPNLPVVYGDRPRLVEVLQNLIDNAAKYMGDQPHPRIEIGQRGEEDSMPVFYVKDNGIGIAPEFHERVFGLFNKLDPRSEGTGVGLALVKRIVEVHGGRIWVESEAGRGSTFLFTLPLRPQA
jgi:PAS domain S-box-containing protein